MGERVTVTYDNFGGGEWGTLGARRARPGMFSGENVRVYRDGKLGPRPGCRPISVSGMPAGTPWGIGYRPITSDELVFIIGDDVYRAAWANGTSATAAGSLTGVPTKIVRFPEGTRRLASTTYFAVYGQSIYSIGVGSAAAVADTPNGQGLDLYRDRLVGSSTNEELHWSDAADFATWDALSYLNVGYEYPAFHLVAHRDGLSIFAQALIWRVTGTLGGSQVLRRASSALAIGSDSEVVLEEDTCFYIPNVRTAPVLWDGGIADERRLAHLEWVAQSTGNAYGGGIARRYNDILFVADHSDDKGLLRSSGVWTFHTFGFPTSAAMSRAEADKFVLLSADATPIPYVLDMDIDRPGFTTDDWSRPGDGSNTPLDASFSLPEWWDPQGRDVRVRSVIVDVTKWATGSATPNQLDMTVTALDRYGPAAALASATQSWTEAGTSATTDGTDERLVFNFGDQGSGGGFQLAVTNLKGCAVRDIAVVLDVQPTRAA